MQNASIGSRDQARAADSGQSMPLGRKITIWFPLDSWDRPGVSSSQWLLRQSRAEIKNQEAV
jgi:hypothetical protein